MSFCRAHSGGIGVMALGLSVTLRPLGSANVEHAWEHSSAYISIVSSAAPHYPRAKYRAGVRGLNERLGHHDRRAHAPRVRFVCRSVGRTINSRTSRRSLFPGRRLPGPRSGSVHTESYRGATECAYDAEIAGGDVIADASKFGRRSLSVIAPLESVRRIV